MAEDREFQIRIRTVADTSGVSQATRAMGELDRSTQRLDGAAKGGAPAWKGYAQNLKEVEEAAAKAAGSDEGGGGGSGLGLLWLRLIKIGGPAIAAGVVLNEALKGMQKEVPALGSAFGKVGGSIRSAFQEVLGGAIKRGLDWILNGDANRKITEWASGWKTVEQAIKSASIVTGEFMAKQRSLQDVLRANREEQRAWDQEASNRMDELDQAAQNLLETKKAINDEERARIDASDMPESEKIMARDSLDSLDKFNERVARQESRDRQIAAADLDQKTRAQEYLVAQNRLAAATKFSLGNESQSDVLDPDTLRTLRDLRIGRDNLRLAAPQKNESAKDANARAFAEEVAKALRQLISEKDKASDAFTDATERARHIREKAATAAEHEQTLEDIREPGRQARTDKQIKEAQAQEQAEALKKQIDEAEAAQQEQTSELKSKLSQMSDMARQANPEVAAKLAEATQAISSSSSAQELDQIGTLLTNMVQSNNQAFARLAQAASAAAQAAEASAALAADAKAKAEAAARSANARR